MSLIKLIAKKLDSKIQACQFGVFLASLQHSLNKRCLDANIIEGDNLNLSRNRALEVLKGQCHEDFAVLGQFCAKIFTFRLSS